MRDPLSVSVCGGGDTLVVRLCGELDMATAPRLDAALASVDGARRVLVDLWDVSFVDASGFCVLVAAHERLDHDGRVLILRGMPPIGLRAMKVLGLDQVLRLDPGM